MHRPEASQHVTFLRAIRDDVVAGDLTAASFARPYDWSEADVERFWEGLSLGLPTGPYLLWSPPGGDAAATSRDGFGPVRVAPGRSAKVLLDGHARVATYVWSLHDLDRTPLPDGVDPSVWTTGRRLVADVARRRVRFADARECAEGSGCMPTHLLANGNGLYRWQRDAMRCATPITQDDADWLDLLAHLTCNTAKTAVTILHGHDRDAAARAFAHLARGGRPWTAAELDGVDAFGRGAAATEPGSRFVNH